MVKRSEEEWQSLFQQQIASGLSVNAFCKEYKLCASYFGQRRKQLQQGHTEATSPRRFVTAKVSSSPAVKGRVVLTYGMSQLTLPASVSERWVANLLNALT